ncbi:NAD(P)H-dependent oxidoreductase [Helicobacter sp. 11S02596-1]|uniref:NAD(P)H-dependent oxidoreductase n=1 Tax=Helicobacter sp. 11S02596-1 TaxID=1476194 RepID=UPI000BA770EE|nr:NAD(P)H-dependent oxidoreductase [Helicobacter sp. 11S02596-1]PAF45011.1 hypothetical protein BJI48_00100 [Helicobacter sp. 11S02596-1]
MKTLILLAHPNIAESRINKTLISGIQNNPDIAICDLYATYPDGKINADKQIALLKAYERIVFQFPLFWFSTPSLLKEYQDVVFSAILYGSEPKMLAGKIFQIITSAGSPEEKYRPDGRNQKSLEDILLPLQMATKYLGMQTQSVFCTYNATGITDAGLEQASQAYKKLLA